MRRDEEIRHHPSAFAAAFQIPRNISPPAPRFPPRTGPNEYASQKEIRAWIHPAYCAISATPFADDQAALRRRRKALGILMHLSASSTSSSTELSIAVAIARQVEILACFCQRQ